MLSGSCLAPLTECADSPRAGAVDCRRLPVPDVSSVVGEIQLCSSGADGPRRRTRSSGGITEAQAVSEGSGPGAAGPGTAPPVTVLVMRQDEAAADGALRPGPAGSEVAADVEDEAGDDDADLLDTPDPAGGVESAASPEELEDEGAEGGGGVRRRGAKTCTYEGCRETTSQVAKQRKPWMCKKHRNKMYKDKYKKKKSDQALGSGGASAASAGSVKLELCASGPGPGQVGATPLSSQM